MRPTITPTPGTASPVSLHISDVSAQKEDSGCQEGQGNRMVSLPLLSPPPDGGAYSFSSAEEASAACDAFFVLFPGLPITLSMYAGTS